MNDPMQNMNDPMQSSDCPPLPLELCDAVLAMSIALLLPTPFPRLDSAHQSTLVTLLNVAHPREITPHALDAALCAMWWFSIDTATVQGVNGGPPELRLDLLGRAIRLRGMHVSDNPQVHAHGRSKNVVPVHVDPSHFQLGEVQDTIKLLEWWMSPQSPTRWVPTLVGLHKRGLARYRGWKIRLAVDAWPHASEILEWWITTGRLNVQDEAELKCAQWMVIDFGSVETINVWREKYDKYMDGTPNVRSSTGQSLKASVACVLTAGDSGAVEYCNSKGLTCSIHRRAVWEACERGHVQGLDWLASLDVRMDAGIDNGINSAAQFGHTPVLDWMLNHGYLTLDAAMDTERVKLLMAIAMAHGHVHVLDWLCAQASCTPVSLFPPDVLDVQEISHPQVLDWLVHHGILHAGVDPPIDGARMFVSAARSHSIAAMEWWLNRAPEPMRLTLAEDKIRCLGTILEANCEREFLWCLEQGFGQLIPHDKTAEQVDWLRERMAGTSSVSLLAFCSQQLPQEGAVAHDLHASEPEPCVVAKCSSMDALEWWIESGHTFEYSSFELIHAPLPMLELLASSPAPMVDEAPRSLKRFALHSAIRKHDLDRVAWWVHASDRAPWWTRESSSATAAAAAGGDDVTAESLLALAADAGDMSMVHWLSQNLGLQSQREVGQRVSDALKRHGTWMEMWQAKKAS